MRSELRKIRLGGKSRFSDDGLIFRRYTQIMEFSSWLPDLGFIWGANSIFGSTSLQGVNEALAKC